MHHQTLRNYVLSTVSPVVHYGLHEMKYTSVAHSMFEISAISFLMGRGYNFHTARQIVESWEVHESFPPFQYTSGYVTPRTY